MEKLKVSAVCPDAHLLHHQDVNLTKTRILELFDGQVLTRTIRHEYIRQLTKEDIIELEKLQKQLSIKVSLNMDDDQEPSICLEGLTSDVFAAESVVRSVC